MSAGDGRARLLFVSPRFLFPVDSGGKIRTTQVLRGMLGGRFHITLASPAPAEAAMRFGDDLGQVCDRFVSWPEEQRGAYFKLTRLRHLVSPLPVAVATDRSVTGSAEVARELEADWDVVVFDFPHCAVLAPEHLRVPSVMFTHNVEAEIFRRHVEVAGNPATRAVWRNQLRKMERFEKAVLDRFDAVVAVSERDKRAFADQFGTANVSVIRTGVDLEFFAYHAPASEPRVVFTGSMDWLANVDGIEYFMDEVWPLIVRDVADASMTVIGRDPPQALVDKARARGLNWRFTGFVDDVRTHVRGAAAFVVPLRVGGGTRLKAYEAMAMGAPMASTSIGIEGLPLAEDEHFLRGDTAQALAGAVVRLLRDGALRQSVARAARQFVESRFSFRNAAQDFENALKVTVINPDLIKLNGRATPQARRFCSYGAANARARLNRS